MTTHQIHWHQDRITGCIQRAEVTINESDTEAPCQVEWLDLACLLDIARTWIAEQDAS
jgi:hypothetical protein